MISLLRLKGHSAPATILKGRRMIMTLELEVMAMLTSWMRARMDTPVQQQVEART